MPLMSLDVSRKICTLAQLTKLAQKHRGGRKVVVHCHGCFDIVHPGHLRYLQFARKQGDVLVVSLTGDDAIEKEDGTRPYIPQELRAETLAALEFVDHVVVCDGPTAESVIQALQPDVYVKGKEYEHSTHPGFVAEKQLIQSYGGRVIYSSGQIIFSSTDLLDRLGQSLEADGQHGQYRVATWGKRWGISPAFLRDLLRHQFPGKRVAVVGDAIKDDYVFCDPANVAGEAPILSVKPLEEATYLGGAAIVASHLKAQGAQPHLITTVGWDTATAEVLAKLDQQKIQYTTFPTHKQLPTKRRYLVENQKLLKVDQATPQPLDSANERKMLDVLDGLKNEIDAIIFVDFGYGTLTSSLLEKAIPLLRPHVGTITGDISGPQQTFMAMSQVDLLTPSERELRSLVGDFEQSLPTIAATVMKKLKLANLAVTMGRHGCVLFRPREDDPAQWFNSRLRSQYLPSLVPHGIDPLGAGDAFLATATLALASGTSLSQAGFVASATAGLEASKVGNQPISVDELEAWLARQPNLLEPTITPTLEQPKLTITRS